MARGCGHTHHERTHRYNNSNNMPWAFWFKVSTAHIEKCTSFRETWLQESTSRQHHQCLLHERSWENTSRQHQQCLVERKWRSTSRHLQQCVVKLTWRHNFAPTTAVSSAAPAPPVEYIASRADFAAPALVVHYTAPAPAVNSAPAHVVDHTAPVPAVYVALLLGILLACSCRSTSRGTLSLSRQTRLMSKP